MAQQQGESRRSDLLDMARLAFDDGGVDAAVATLTSVDATATAGAAFDDLAQSLYRQRQDVANMLAVAEAGVDFCLRRAESAGNADEAHALKTLAKTIAFNAGANCWPGWGDEGVVITLPQMQSGLALAEACCDLARELGLGPKPTSVGIWLTGALKLAIGEVAEASADFQQAHTLAEAAGDADNILLMAGYRALARKADPVTALAGAVELEQAIARLRDLGSKHASFFAKQLTTADAILLAN